MRATSLNPSSPTRNGAVQVHAPPPPPPVPGPARGMIGALRDWTFSWLGPTLSKSTPAYDNVTREKLAGGPRGIQFPWFEPYIDDRTGTGQTQAMVLAYRKMWGSAVVKSAVCQRIFGVAALKLVVAPATKKNPRDQAIADFVRWNYNQRLSGGFSGLVWGLLSGAYTDGYSVHEKVWQPTLKGKYAGKIGLAALKMKDVGNDLILRSDEFRNITSLQGLQYNGGQEFNPSDFVIFQNLKMYERPTAMSEFRSVYTAFWIRNTAWMLRGRGLVRQASPLLVGHYGIATSQPGLNASLSQAESQNWLSVPEDVRLEAVNIAGGSQDYFKSAIADLDQEIFLGLTGGTLQALTGQADVHSGSSKAHATTADSFKWFASERLAQKLNDYDDGLTKDIVDLNYVCSEYPQCTLSAVSAEEMAAELAVDNGLHTLGLDLSKEETYERYGRSGPHDNEPDDCLKGGSSGPAPGAFPGGIGPDGKPVPGNGQGDKGTGGQGEGTEDDETPETQPDGSKHPKPPKAEKFADVSTEARAPDGKWTAGGGSEGAVKPDTAPKPATGHLVGTPTAEHHATAAQYAAAAPGLSPETAAKYTEDLAHALSLLPAGAAKEAASALKHGGVKFHPDLTALRAEAKKLSGENDASVVGFAKDRGMATDVHLDGGDDPRGTYIHELWHAADNQGVYSDHKDWQAAYKKDILKGKHLLSRYAMTNASEGFAEVGRMLAERGAEQMTKCYPTVMKYLAAKKLL